MLRRAIVAILGLALLGLAACAGEPPTPLPVAADAAIDDRILERYVALIPRWRERIAAGDRGLGWLAGEHFAPASWERISRAVARVQAERSYDAARENARLYEGRIAEVEARRGGAGGDEAERLDRQIAAMRQGQRDLLVPPPVLEEPIDPEEVLVIEAVRRWLDRIHGATRAPPR
jgi:hypothetical protein